MSFDRTADPPVPVRGSFAVMLAELPANRASMDTANRACLWLFRGGRAGA